MSEHLWQRMNPLGRPKAFNSPEELWDACLEYFIWNEENPLYIEKAHMYQGTIIKDKIEKRRLMTKGAMLLFINTNETTWRDMKQERSAYAGMTGFSRVCEDVEEAIRKQKLEGAAADQFNAMIVSRDLGLVDRSAVDQNTVEAKTTVDPSKLSKAAKKEILQAMREQQEAEEAERDA